jgi:hypothetical protein
MTDRTLSHRALIRRSRLWTTGACMASLMLALGLLLSGHLAHGALLMLVPVFLFKHSSLGRRKVSAGQAWQPAASAAEHRKWRKAA